MNADLNKSTLIRLSTLAEKVASRVAERNPLNQGGVLFMMGFATLCPSTMLRNVHETTSRFLTGFFAPDGMISFVT